MVCRYFLPSGSPCRTQVLVIRDFTTTCTCTCKHALLCNVYAHICTMRLYMLLAYLSVCGYTCQPAQWHLSSCGYSRQSYPRGSTTAEQSSALDSSSGVVRMWVRIPAWPLAALVSLSKTLNHNCFVLRMGRKAVGPVCCVMHVKEPRTLIVKAKGLAPVFLDSCLEHPAGWIFARYKSSVLLLLLLLLLLLTLVRL